MGGLGVRVDVECGVDGVAVGGYEVVGVLVDSDV